MTPQPTPVTFVHTADWQLGKPFAGIADPAKRARVQQERFEAIRRIAAVVRARQARFVVVAGDLFDSPTPAHATISATLGAIADLGVPVFAIPGNHDHAGPDSLWEQAFFQRERARLAPEFHLLAVAEPVPIDLPDRGSGPARVTLLPCPLLRRHEADDPTAWLRDLDPATLDDAPRIVLAHGSTTAFAAAGTARHDDDDGPAPGAAANMIALDRLPHDALDYVALGDWHGLVCVGPHAWYAGTPEIDRFPRAGQEPGHVACVTVGRGLPPTVTAVRTGRFRWLSLELALADHATAGDLEGPRGPAHLDEWLTQATRPAAPGEPGFDACLANIAVSGSVSLAGRAELDRVIESWRARLLRLDLVDTVRLAPTADEIASLAARPGDPIISRVATELVERLGRGGAAPDLDVVRHAIAILHALAHPGSAAGAGPSGATAAAAPGGPGP